MVTDEYVLQLKDYFDIVGSRRIGRYMTELRHLVVKELNQNGFNTTHILKVTGMTHDKQNYLLSDRYVNIEDSDYIKENMHQWIADKLFPCSIRVYVDPNSGENRTRMHLSNDPTYKMEPQKKGRKHKNISPEIDRMLSRLNI